MSSRTKADCIAVRINHVDPKYSRLITYCSLKNTVSSSNEDLVVLPIVISCFDCIYSHSFGWLDCSDMRGLIDCGSINKQGAYKCPKSVLQRPALMLSPSNCILIFSIKNTLDTSNPVLKYCGSTSAPFFK